MEQDNPKPNQEIPTPSTKTTTTAQENPNTEAARQTSPSTALVEVPLTSPTRTIGRGSPTSPTKTLVQNSPTSSPKKLVSPTSPPKSLMQLSPSSPIKTLVQTSPILTAVGVMPIPSTKKLVDEIAKRLYESQEEKLKMGEKATTSRCLPESSTNVIQRNVVTQHIMGATNIGTYADMAKQMEQVMSQLNEFSKSECPVNDQTAKNVDPLDVDEVATAIKEALEEVDKIDDEDNTESVTADNSQIIEGFPEWEIDILPGPAITVICENDFVEVVASDPSWKLENNGGSMECEVVECDVDAPVLGKTTVDIAEEITDAMGETPMEEDTEHASRCQPFQVRKKNAGAIFEILLVKYRGDTVKPILAKQNLLMKLRAAIIDGQIEWVIINSKFLLDLLVVSLESEHSDTTAVILLFLIAVFKNRAVISFWSSFAEAIESVISHILQARGSERADVSKAATRAISCMILLIPVNPLLMYLHELMFMPDDHNLLGVIQIVTKMIQKRGLELQMFHVDHIMTCFNHILTHGNPREQVDDNAVLGMVILHLAVGKKKMQRFIKLVPMNNIDLYWNYMHDLKKRNNYE